MAKISFKKLFSFQEPEIKQAFKNAQQKNKIVGLKLLQAPLENQPHGKLLIIIPKKSGKASARNRIRRQIKAIFYEEKLYESNKISILIVYKEAMAIPIEQLKAFLKENV